MKSRIAARILESLCGGEDDERFYELKGFKGEGVEEDESGNPNIGHIRKSLSSFGHQLVEFFQPTQFQLIQTGKCLVLTWPHLIAGYMTHLDNPSENAGLSSVHLIVRSRNIHF